MGLLLKQTMGKGAGIVDPLKLVLTSRCVEGPLTRVEPFLDQEGGESAQ